MAGISAAGAASWEAEGQGVLAQQSQGSPASSVDDDFRWMRSIGTARFPYGHLTVDPDDAQSSPPEVILRLLLGADNLHALQHF